MLDFVNVLDLCKGSASSCSLKTALLFHLHFSHVFSVVTRVGISSALVYPWSLLGCCEVLRLLLSVTAQSGSLPPPHLLLKGRGAWLGCWGASGMRDCSAFSTSRLQGAMRSADSPPGRCLRCGEGTVLKLWRILNPYGTLKCFHSLLSFPSCPWLCLQDTSSGLSSTADPSCHPRVTCVCCQLLLWC